MDRYRGAGEISQTIEVMFATIDHRRPGFNQCSAQRVGAASGFAPAGTQGDVLQAAAFKAIGAPFDGENGGIGVGENNQPFLALTFGQVINRRQCCVDQQSVAGQQRVEAGARFQCQFVFAIEMHAMTEAAPPRRIDFRAQYAIGDFALEMELFPSQPGFAVQFGWCCFYWRHQALRIGRPALF
ncbi:hypothetical protein D3C84_889830 [compost metagenome]